MKELVRLTKPGGHGTLHLLSVHHMPDASRTYEQECLNHVNNVDEHWMHYYSFDEIWMLFSAEELGVTDLDIKYYRTSFWVHFEGVCIAPSETTTWKRSSSSLARCPTRSAHPSRPLVIDAHARTA